MNLDEMRREEERRASRSRKLAEMERNQGKFEDHFWSVAFPVIQKNIERVLRAKCVSYSWSTGDRFDRTWYRLKLWESMYLTIDAFDYRVTDNEQGHIRLEYRCHENSASAGDNIDIEPSSISLRVIFGSGTHPGDDAMCCGHYRFRWFDERDTGRIADNLIAILDGKKPQSDFKLGGNCFIASAVYGLHTPETEALRLFRDSQLSGNAPGRLFITTYYAISPPIAQIVIRHPVLKRLFRFILGPVVGCAEYFNGHRREKRHHTAPEASGASSAPLPE